MYKLGIGEDIVSHHLMKGHFSELPDELLQSIALATDPSTFSSLRIASKDLQSKLPIPFSTPTTKSVIWNTKPFNVVKEKVTKLEKSLVKKVQLVSRQPEMTVHYLASGNPLLSIPPPPGRNLHMYDPIEANWIPAPDLYLVSDRSFYSDWVVFYFDGATPYNTISYYDSEKKEFSQDNSILWSALSQSKASIEPWFEKIFNKHQENIVFELDGSPYAAWEDSSFSMVDFQIYGNVMVIKKALKYDNIVYHHLSAFKLHNSSEPTMLWHRILDFAIDCDYGVTENSLILELREKTSCRFVTLDLLTGYTMHAKTFSSGIFPTLKRTFGYEGRLVMPRSSSLIFDLKDGKLSVWSLPSFDIVLDGFTLDSSLKELGNLQVSYDGSVLLLDSSSSVYVVDALSKTIKVIEKGLVLAFLDREQVNQVALLNKP